MDVILPRRKKCKYGNKILTYHFHRLYINIYMREKDFHIKRFYSLCKSIFDVGFGSGLFFFLLPFFSVACCTADVLGLLKNRQIIACRCREF